ncbi:hypothetical protein ES703_67871 [subsurface metagenome]
MVKQIPYNKIRKILKKKPLIEAIFELRWQLSELKSGAKMDRHYRLLIGRIYEMVKKDYPSHEPLSSANLPDEMAGHIVQHRFRKDKDKWPLVQIGPGIITLNDTESYSWDDFIGRIKKLLKALFETYPKADKNLKISSLLLRYIDSVEFNFSEDNIFNFLSDELKIRMNLYDELFKKTGVSKFPLGFNLSFLFSSKKPKGAVHLRFSRGKRNNKDALIWEEIVQSIEKDVPKTIEKIVKWSEDAHNLTGYWFFKMLEGSELIRRFE